MASVRSRRTERFSHDGSELLPRESFGRDASKASGLKSIGKECDRAKARAYYERERQARKGNASRG